MTRVGLALALVCALLALLAGGLAHLLTGGERYAFTLVDGPHIGAYVMDIPHRLVYLVGRNVVMSLSRYPLNPQNPDEVAVSRMDQRGLNLDLYILNLFTHDTRRLTDEPGFDGDPAWSPDGQRLAFVSDRSGSWNLYVVDLMSGISRPLTHNPVGVTNPAWSPDGRYIAYDSAFGEGGSHLFVTDSACLTGEGVCVHADVQITSSAGRDYLPAWSPDGKQLAFVSDRSGSPDVYVMNTACLEAAVGCIQQNARQLTHRSFFRVDDVQWSADGQSIWFVAYLNGGLAAYWLEAGCDLQPAGCIPQLLTVIR